ncbi:hypothetical protein F2P81_024561 [Scophthalmus maximus]|uniref:Uncharacterized protein n=1 Tax=Scophthalmus maximus TaxID=52904 RepID=A0A6A4RXY4_SCOMX|nr:hypothetical protein F2P81_024561 [Scophthalmus maximus]
MSLRPRAGGIGAKYTPAGERGTSVVVVASGSAEDVCSNNEPSDKKKFDVAYVFDAGYPDTLPQTLNPPRIRTRDPNTELSSEPKPEVHQKMRSEAEPETYN